MLKKLAVGPIIRGWVEISCQATASLESGSSTILQSSFSIFQQILHYVGTYVVDIFKKSLIYYFSITGKARKQKREKVWVNDSWKKVFVPLCGNNFVRIVNDLSRKDSLSIKKVLMNMGPQREQSENVHVFIRCFSFLTLSWPLSQFIFKTEDIFQSWRGL